jgi:serine/threonine protein kinase
MPRPKSDLRPFQAKLGTEDREALDRIAELLGLPDRSAALRHAIRDGHTGGIREKLKIALQVSRALEYIHSQKIVHRDIKPENILVDEAGVVKLMDFGIAKTEGLAMTRAGYVLGTPFYMAPEQVTGQPVTEQVDVYAFGVLLFELFTGSKPINGETVERIFYSILNEPLDLGPLRSCGAPEDLAELVAQCTAKDPAQRPRGFAPVCAEIERMSAELDALIEKQNQAYTASLQQVETVVKGFAKVEMPKPQKVKTTIKDLQSQLAYMDKYTKNLEKAKELGLSDELKRAFRWFG